MKIFFFLGFCITTLTANTQVDSLSYRCIESSFNTIITISKNSNLHVLQHNLSGNSIPLDGNYTGITYQIELSDDQKESLFIEVNKIPECEMCDTIVRNDGSSVIIERDIFPNSNSVELFQANSLKNKLYNRQPYTPIISSVLDKIHDLRKKEIKRPWNTTNYPRTIIKESEIKSIELTYRFEAKEDSREYYKFLLPISYHPQVLNTINRSKKIYPYNKPFLDLFYNYKEELGLLIKTESSKIYGSIDLENEYFRMNNFYWLELDKSLIETINKFRLNVRNK